MVLVRAQLLLLFTAVAAKGLGVEGLLLTNHSADEEQQQRCSYAFSFADEGEIVVAL